MTGNESKSRLAEEIWTESDSEEAAAPSETGAVSGGKDLLWYRWVWSLYMQWKSGGVMDGQRDNGVLTSGDEMDETGMTLTKWNRKLIPETNWCI